MLRDRLRLPILEDASKQFGFLHRLDVPSSGLLLLATSSESYLHLDLLLRSGAMKRSPAQLRVKVSRHLRMRCMCL